MPEHPNNLYDGYSLFFDVESKDLRSHNRGAVLRNIAEGCMSEKGKLTATGSLQLLGYYGNIPANERKAALEVFMQRMKEDGYEVGV